jgi:CMP/dCMP kinase
MIITIDGPVASGKSTAARLLARQLNFYYLNSGLLYRAIGYLLLNKAHYSLEQLASADRKDVDTYLDEKRLRYAFGEQGVPHLSFDEQDITPLLKSEMMDKAASVVSTNPYVRERLLHWQRNLAANHNVVSEGRDSGTVVFPSAILKFFLTAPVIVRAGRWQADQERRGLVVTIQDAQAQIEERDTRDSSRSVAPLIVPEGAIIIDNGSLSLEETVTLMQSYVEQAMR